MDNFEDWLGLGQFHDYVETEPLLPNQRPGPPKKEPEPPPEPSRKKLIKNKKLREIVTFFTPMVIALTVALLLRGFVFTNTRVPTGSMESTIASHSRILGSKLTYAFNDPQRYDIVIFKFPDDESVDYVKRVIGLPGEKVEIIDGKVYINDSAQPLRDDFITEGVPAGDWGPYYVPEDSYFMLGDNRGNSADSRYWTNHFVKRNKIIAKVSFVYYPEWKKVE